MTDFFRWQWMWRSRARLIGLALGAMAIGGIVVAFALLTAAPFRKANGLMLYGGITFVAIGGYQLLQGLFSPAEAFGDHDGRDEEEYHRRRVRRLLRRAATDPKRGGDGQPLPLTGERDAGT